MSTIDDVKQRLLIVIVAYNADATIDTVLGRIPRSLTTSYDLEVLVLDDCSKDSTFLTTLSAVRERHSELVVTVLTNPENQGYGGNQKIGYAYAIEEHFDYVVLLHGDAQYPPELIPDIVEPLRNDTADAVLGSRMQTAFGALRGGMPLYKYMGNRILTFFQNHVLHASLSEYHTGFRAYRVASLMKVPFVKNTNAFHFDTEIIIQLLASGARISEIGIPTHYGDEVCYVNGMEYAADVVLSTLKFAVQRWNIFYDPKFDIPKISTQDASSPNLKKTKYLTPQAVALKLIGKHRRVLDLGSAPSDLTGALHRLRSSITEYSPSLLVHPSTDRNSDGPVQLSSFDWILLLDVLDTVEDPALLLEKLGRELRSSGTQSTQILVSTGNVSFIIPRLMLLLGQFNYSKRGILSITSRWHFTLRSLRRLLEQSGFLVETVYAIPAPVPLVMPRSVSTKLLYRCAALLAHGTPGLFAYQFVIRAHAVPELGSLLHEAKVTSAKRAKELVS